MNLHQLAEVAVKAAIAAGKIIQQNTNGHITYNEKNTGSSQAAKVLTEVDLSCEKLILTHLKESCVKYDIALLSEETEDDGSRFIKEYFWCIDPMDGTLAFINKYPGFSVSIALVARDGTPHIGVVYDPSNHNVYHAIRGTGVYKNGSPWNPENKNKFFTYVTDKKLSDTPQAPVIRKYLDNWLTLSGLDYYTELSGAGSVLNAILVLENGPACMIKLPKEETGGGSIWDYAATSCIFNELKLPATNYHGGKLDLNKQSNTYMNHEGVLFCSY